MLAHAVPAVPPMASYVATTITISLMGAVLLFYLIILAISSPFKHNAFTVARHAVTVLTLMFLVATSPPFLLLGDSLYGSVQTSLAENGHADWANENYIGLILLIAVMALVVLYNSVKFLHKNWVVILIGILVLVFAVTPFGQNLSIWYAENIAGWVIEHVAGVFTLG